MNETCESNLVFLRWGNFQEWIMAARETRRGIKCQLKEEKACLTQQSASDLVKRRKKNKKTIEKPFTIKERERESVW